MCCTKARTVGLPPPRDSKVRPLKGLTVNVDPLLLICPDYRDPPDPGNAGERNRPFKNQLVTRLSLKVFADIIVRLLTGKNCDFDAPIIGPSVIDARAQPGIKTFCRQTPANPEI